MMMTEGTGKRWKEPKSNKRRKRAIGCEEDKMMEGGREVMEGGSEWYSEAGNDGSTRGVREAGRGNRE